MDSEFVTYVLYSKNYNKIYIGFTSNLIVRFLSHNKLGKGFTAKYSPWEVFIWKFFSQKMLRCNEKRN
ncbi:MAG: GIY-YIG nuclease family protein [Lutibacter sp.]